MTIEFFEEVLMFVFLLGIILFIVIILFLLCKEPSSESSKLVSIPLTFKELEEKSDEYERQLKGLTSVQLQMFKKNNCYVYFDNHLESHIATIKTPVLIDDTCIVKNVFRSHLYKGKYSVDCYCVTCTNGFEFPTSLDSGAGNLSKGQKIHINGIVFFKLDSLCKHIIYDCKNFVSFKIEEAKNEKESKIKATISPLVDKIFNIIFEKKGRLIAIDIESSRIHYRFYITKASDETDNTGLQEFTITLNEIGYNDLSPNEMNDLAETLTSRLGSDYISTDKTVKYKFEKEYIDNKLHNELVNNNTALIDESFLDEVISNIFNTK